MLCLASNDAGEALIAIPVTLAGPQPARRARRRPRDALARTRRSPRRKANKALISAVAALDKRLQAGNWDDGVRPDAAGGRTVYDALVRAVKELNKIGEPLVAVDAVNSLVAAGQEISAVAIGEAPAGPIKDKADQGAAARRPDGQRRARKLESYRSAWACRSRGLAPANP